MFGNKIRLLALICFPLCLGVGCTPAVQSHIATAPPPGAFDSGLDNQLGLTFSPDARHAFWVAWDGKWGSGGASQRIIYTSRYAGGTWRKPAPAPFSGSHSDGDPFVSPDGEWLYFVSDRPPGGAGGKRDDDIWRYSLIEEGRLEHLSINSTAAEYSPVVTASGAVYFASARDGGMGRGDLYRAAPADDGFHPPQRLGAALNSATGEWNLWVSPDEDDIVFEASSRPTNVSIPGDLYYSWRTPSGWTAAVPIESLNTGDSDLMPRLHPDGETLYYTTAPIGGHARIASTRWQALRAQARGHYAPTLLVANRSSHDISFVDLALGEVVGRVATGEGPHLLSNVNEGRVLATGYGQFPQPHPEPVARRPPFVSAPNSRLTMVDTVSRKVLLNTTLADCANPHASWLLGQRAYVSCESEQRVLVLDLENGSSIGSFDTRQKGSHVLSYAPQSRTLASSNTDSGSVTLIDIDSGEIRVVELASGSEGALAVAGRLWVANALDGSVSIVDPRQATVAKHIDAICKFPIALSRGQQGHVWVACFMSSELVSIDPDSFEVKRNIPLDAQPLNLLIHPTRMLAYVSFPRRNAIAEISLTSGRELRRITVGIEPDGLRWATDGP